ncbi:MAG TPA: LPS assembly lipoprotein LptE [Propylenella sp.]
MSSARSILARAVLLPALLIGLAACQLRPLYAPSAGSAGPQADLPAITVDTPLTRPEQVFRNALLFSLRGGGDGQSPRYGLVYRMTVREQEIAVERGTGTPNAYQLVGGVSFLLKDAGTGASLFGTSVTAIDTYTRSSQNYANVRARRDAEDRLAKVLAELTQARLAAYFATN